MAGPGAKASWLNDPHWTSASEAALESLDEAEVVLVPEEFLPLSERFAPLEFSWGLEATVDRIAFCCVKDDVDRLAPALRDAAFAGTHRHRWANEVFVVGANFSWRSPARLQLRQHIGYWQTKVGRYRRGVAVRAPRLRPIPPDVPPSADGPVVLLVGASGMGNIGDDLLAGTLGQLCYRAGASQVAASPPDIDALHLKPFDAVIVGGGGLLYASRDGRKEWQNLANYLRFGPLCRSLGIPVAMIGVADQDHAHAIEREPLVAAFARRCLADFSIVTVRDVDSAALCRRLGVADPLAGSDMVFLSLDRALDAPRPMRVGVARIALAGELFAYPPFERAVDALDHDALEDREFDYLVMSDDDVPHGRRLRSRFRELGATVSIVDLRGHTVESLVFQLSSVQGLVTTRFHGLVLAALAGLPVLALDGREGKKTRLLESMDAREDALVLAEDASSEAAGRIVSALAGQMTTIRMPMVEREARLAAMHGEAVAGLLSTCESRSSAPVSLRTIARRGFGAPSPTWTADSAPTAPVSLRELVVDGEVPLCWAASTPETLGFANLGDSLSAVVVSALSGRRVRHVNFETEQTKLVAVGSIAHLIRGGTAVVWGSGVSIRGGILPRNRPFTRYDVRATRGPISAAHLRNLDIQVPEVYGDPVWFLPSIFREPVDKRYELGVIPHIQDVEGFGPGARPAADSLRYKIDASDADDIVLINTWHEPTWEGIAAKLRAILSCRRIASQSFHGLVIAEAFGIPVLNLRAHAKAPNGSLRISLRDECATDPRVWEFYRGGCHDHYDLYVQRRDQRTDWSAVIRAIDRRWRRFEFDPTALARSFPLPLAYDPLTQAAEPAPFASLRF